MKLLSIIVPTYNMEAYLAQCVESVLRTPSLAPIEVVIVNDGSSDHSLRIAKSFAERYTNTVRVIDKPNGNYGSTINAALPTLRGEYVKILDADDRFDGSKIAQFLDSLQKLRGVDMVVTPFVEWNGKRELRVDYNIYSRKVYNNNEPYDAEKIFGEGAIRYFMMHSVCYRTQMLRDGGYRQTEGVSYTDQEWVFYPLFDVKTIAFIDTPLYRYNTSREGQTMDSAVQLRSLGQLLVVTRAMAQHFITKSQTSLPDVRTTFLRGIVADRLRIVYRKYLLMMSSSQFAKSDFDSIDNELSPLASECGIEELKVPVNNLLKVDLLRHWRRHHRRHNNALLWLLRTTNDAMVKIHALLFRRG